MDEFYSFEKLISLKDFYPFVMLLLLFLFFLVYNYNFGFKIFEVISIIGICILFSLRYIPSYFISDISRYIEVFNEIDSFSSIFNNSMSWKKDHLFFFVGYCAKLISSNYHFLLFVFLISSTLIIYNTLLNGNVIINNRVSLLFLFLIFSSPFFISLNTNLIRQGLVVSFSFFLFYRYKNRRITFLSFIISLLPLLIHKSYLIFLILFYLNRMLSFKKILLLVVSVYFLKNFILAKIQIPILNEIIQISSRIEIYSTHDVNSINFLIPRVIFYLIATITLYYLTKKHKGLHPDLKFVLLTIIFSVLFIDFPIISKRLLYFIPLILIKSLHDFIIVKRKRSSILVLVSLLIIVQSIIVSNYSKSISDIAFKVYT